VTQHNRRMQGVTLDSDRLLLVEGRDEVLLFRALIQNRFQRSPPVFQIIPAGGKDQFPTSMRAIAVAAATRPQLQSIGVIRDADDNPEGAFQSVCNHLGRAGFEYPEHHAGFTESIPHVGVFIVPDGKQPGAIETLCRQSVKDTGVAQCAEKYLTCLSDHNVTVSGNLDKSFTHAYLAAARNPVSRVGEGAQQGIWSLESQVFNELANFLAVFLGTLRAA